MRLDNKGFSLVELMTVVAIIAALSVIAVPAYKTFQARARQKQGFNMLNSFYTAAVATRTEFGLFPGNLVATGFAPVGQLNYRLRSNDNPNDLPGTTVFNNDDGCLSTDMGCDCGGNCPNFKTWDETAGAAGTIGADCAGCSACPVLGAVGTTDDTFVVGISGWISTTASTFDRYFMNDQKTIQMCDDGLK